MPVTAAFAVCRAKPRTIRREECDRVENQRRIKRIEFSLLRQEIEGWYEQKQVPPQIRAGEDSDFFGKDFFHVRPIVAVKVALPAIVKIIELRVVVFHGSTRRFPKENRAWVVELLIERHGESARATCGAPVVVAKKSNPSEKKERSGEKNFCDAFRK